MCSAPTLSYAQRISTHFRANRNDQMAVRMKQYMRNQFEFLGLQSPRRKELLKAFVDEHGRPASDADLLEIFRLKEREFKYISMDLASHRVKALKERGRIQTYIEFAKIEPWWDTIDIIASKLIGSYFLNFKASSTGYTDEWIKDDSLWFRRISLIYQLSYKKQTNLPLLYKYIESTIDESEFFIQKAIGWSLRQVYRHNPKSVLAFVKSHPNLSNLSKREALKHHNKKSKETDEEDEEEDDEEDEE